MKKMIIKIITVARRILNLATDVKKRNACLRYEIQTDDESTDVSGLAVSLMSFVTYTRALLRKIIL